jgi:hypothetical protein
MTIKPIQFIELIARVLCQCDAIDPDGFILDGLPHWRKYEWTAACVANAIFLANTERMKKE